jgi:hypothetical protein
MWTDYDNYRTVTTLRGALRLRLKIRCCPNPECARYHLPYRPEAEGRIVLPKHEFGLEVIALVGSLRYQAHRSLPEVHQELRRHGVAICRRTVSNLLERYDELLALSLGDDERLRQLTLRQGRVILAIDGLQPDVGHEALPVPIAAVISDGKQSLRKAVKQALPGVPHQLCQFHYLREAARPSYEADRHAKKELKKQLRGIRAVERQAEARADVEAKVVQGYKASPDNCAAVRSALSDDARPPLAASGLKLQQRLSAIDESLDRVTEKGGCPGSWRG